MARNQRSKREIEKEEIGKKVNTFPDDHVMSPKELDYRIAQAMVVLKLDRMAAWIREERYEHKAEFKEMTMRSPAGDEMGIDSTVIDFKECLMPEDRPKEDDSYDHPYFFGVDIEQAVEYLEMLKARWEESVESEKSED